MAEMRLIQALIDDLSQQQPISTALCIGQNIEASPKITIKRLMSSQLSNGSILAHWHF